MKKYFFTTLLVFILASTVCFASGKKENSDFSKSNIRIGVLNGPSSIPVAYIIENNKSNLLFEKYADPQALLTKMIKGEVDIGFLPVNVAAKVYNSASNAILCVGISGYGNLFLITKDNTISSFKDLKGKSVAVAGQGATPEYLFRYLLEKSGVGENNVKLDFSTPTANIAQGVIAGKIEYALVPEPFATVATSKSSEVIRAIDFQKEFQNIENTSAIYPLTVMVVNSSFATSNSKDVRNFIKLFEVSCKWTIANPKEAGELVQKNELGLMAPVVEESIPYANFVWKDAISSKVELENMLSIFLHFAPDSIGGKLPDEGFYFK